MGRKTMSRETRFRAWYNWKKKYRQPTKRALDKGMYKVSGIDFDKGTVFLNCGRFLNERTRLINCNLMQYTGLKDKNGVEIYEGDIVTLGEDYINFSIGFEDGAFCSSANGYDGDYKEYEVIGNIHQNPELLERGA